MLGLDYWPEEKPTCLQRREVYSLDQMKEKIFSFLSHRIRVPIGAWSVCAGGIVGRGGRGEAVKNNDGINHIIICCFPKVGQKCLGSGKGRGVRRQRVMTQHNL